MIGTVVFDGILFRLGIESSEGLSRSFKHREKRFGSVGS